MSDFMTALVKSLNEIVKALFVEIYQEFQKL